VFGGRGWEGGESDGRNVGFSREEGGKKVPGLASRRQATKTRFGGQLGGRYQNTRDEVLLRVNHDVGG